MAAFVLLLVGSLLAGDPADAAEVRLQAAAMERQVVGVFEPCELTVRLEGEVADPYNPDELSLEAIFTPPKGAPVTVYGFFYQPFQRLRDASGRETLEPAGEPLWKIRFTPRRIGRWSYAVRVVTPQGTQALPAASFEAIASRRPGFIQVDRDRRVLRFETGPPFIPVGENLAWGPNVQMLQAYERWFRDLARQRANYIRVWLAPWSLRLETKDTTVGHYDQARAWQLDYLLDQSERAGLYWQLCLLDHGSFSRTQDPAWQDNPYNQALGGMCRVPNEFLADPRAKAMFQRLLRYLVSRWGAHPQLVAWELFNEPDLSELRMEEFVPWVVQMSQALRGLDVNQRPITVSFHHAAPPAVWRLPTIDLIQVHRYDERDFGEAFSGPLLAELAETYQKPVMVGEFGWINEFVRKIDRTGIHLHDGLWASALSGALGGGLSWYWDSYVHPNALYQHLRPLARFWGGEPIVKPLKRMDLSLSDGRLLGCSVGTSQRAYLWIKNRAHTVDQYLAYRCAAAKERLRQARGQTPRSVQYAPPAVQGARVTVKGLALGGRYRVEWWDAYRGRVMATAVEAVHRGAVTAEVPAVSFDVAGKLIRLHWWERE